MLLMTSVGTSERIETDGHDVGVNGNLVLRYEEADGMISKLTADILIVGWSWLTLHFCKNINIFCSLLYDA